MQPKGHNAPHFNGPSLLNHIYLASQSPDCAIIGATYKYDYTSTEALSELDHNLNQSWPRAYESSAIDYLHSEGKKVWRPLTDWEPVQLRTGVRALPPKTHRGALPLLRFLNPNIWIISGLGTRGLLYHAYLGATTAHSILDDPIAEIETL